MGTMLKGKLYEVVKIRVSETVMAVVLVFEEDVLMLICGYALCGGRNLERKTVFLWQVEW